MKGTQLSSDRETLVPADLAHWPTQRDASVPDLFRLTTNGMACGNTLHEATVHGMCEVIERDGLQRDHESGGRNRRLVDHWNVEDQYCHKLIDQILRARMWLEIAIVDNPYEVPVCAAYIRSEDYPVTFAGAGAHRDPHIALSRALTDAAQSRVTRIAGTRDNIDTDGHVFAACPPRPHPAVAELAGRGEQITRYEAADEDFGQEAVMLAGQITAVTRYEPIAVTLHDSAAYAAVKIVSPGTTERITRSISRPLVPLRGSLSRRARKAPGDRPANSVPAGDLCGGSRA